MPVVRIYLPIGRRDLDDLVETGLLDASAASPREAFGVTEGLRSRATGLDVEELEYAAFADAVAASAAARSAPGARRVVAAADADPAWVVDRAGGAVSSLSVVAPVPGARIASFHVDEQAGVAGDSAATEAGELLWYDVTELDEVRRMLA
ncbi:hypothetical protein [Intrasporangium sp. DVR]|uniref:DUF6912 family protein n=1 Tax=Intrasporangium sp. DVR TaxID=3127867 RepID=UPI00313A6192